MRLKTGRRGSLTVEAAIALPLFLCFFFLMVFVIKAACIHISLDQAVQETVKEIAAKAYPLSFLNERVDELQKDNDGAIAALSIEISGRQFTEQLGYSWGKEIQETIAKALLKKYLAGTYVNADEICLRVVEFPQSDWEYERSLAAICENGGSSDSNQGLLPKQDFGKDDTAIELEYKLAVPLPFFSDWQITFRHAAVEKAWLVGSNGVYSNREDRGIYEQITDTEVVYITRTGIKYHMDGCRYLQKSKIPLSLKEAQKSYGACKVCQPKH